MVTEIQFLNANPKKEFKSTQKKLWTWLCYCRLQLGGARARAAARNYGGHVRDEYVDSTSARMYMHVHLSIYILLSIVYIYIHM